MGLREAWNDPDTRPILALIALIGIVVVGAVAVGWGLVFIFNLW